MTLTDNEYFANLTRAVFVTGFSREVINSKWDGFLDAFQGFDPEIIAQWKEDDLNRLLDRDDIIRNKRKIEATFHNAKVFLKLRNQYGSIYDYIRSFDDLDHDEKVKRLKEPFKFVGPTTATIFLYISGEKVPHRG